MFAKNDRIESSLQKVSRSNAFLDGCLPIFYSLFLISGYGPLSAEAMSQIAKEVVRHLSQQLPPAAPIRRQVDYERPTQAEREARKRDFQTALA